MKAERRLAGFVKRRRRPRGFTLIEVMVATAVSLVLIGLLVQAFAFMSDNVRSARSVISDAMRLRGAAARLQADLDGATAMIRPPLSPDVDQGYFEIVEGPRGPVIIENVDVDSDDVLMFTVRSLGSPFVGRYGSSYVESQVAEVAWFVRDDKLHRRVLLVLPELGTTFSNTSPFYGSNDISVRRNGSVYTANSLGDLTKRENRFAHQPATFPHDVRFWMADSTSRLQLGLKNPQGPIVGLPTLQESSSSAFPFPASASGGYVTPAGLTISNGVGTLTGTSDFDPQTGLLTAYKDGTRAAEDVVLENVVGFDVKVWDPGAPVVFVADAPPPAGLPNALRFDFGNGPLQSGFTSVRSSKTSGPGHYIRDNEPGSTDSYGFEENDRGTGAPAYPNASMVPLLQDSLLNSNWSFFVDVPVGTYRVKVYLGDHNWPRNQNRVFIEGKLIGTYDVAANAFPIVDQTVTVTDGVMQFDFVDMDPPPKGSRQVAVCGIEVLNLWDGFTVQSPQLEDLSWSRSYDFGPGPVQAGHIQVTNSGTVGVSGSGSGTFTGTGILSNDRAINTDLLRDHVGLANVVGNNMTFKVTVPYNGGYDVVLTVGDAGPWGHEGDVVIHGVNKGRITSAASSFTNVSATVSVTAGELNVSTTCPIANHLPFVALVITYKPPAGDPNAVIPAMIPPSARPSAGVGVRPGDTGYFTSLKDTLNSNANRSYAKGYGAFVDLNYLARLGPKSGNTNEPNYTPAANTPESQFGGPGNPASGMSGTPPFTASSAALPSGVVAKASVYDTWSQHYEYDGANQDSASGADQGVAPGVPAGVNGIGASMEAPPPYASPLRGIQIRIRIMNPASREVREMTIVHDLLWQ